MNESGNIQDDGILVADFKQSGNLQVLGSLYGKYMDLIYAVCLKYLKNTEDAKDAVGNIFEELIVKLPKYEVANFRPWLHTLAKNHCLMKLRASKNITTDLTENLMYFDETLHPEDVVTKEKQLSRMEECLETLPEGQKAAVKLFYLQEKCYKEIADETGLEMGMVRSQIQNGRRNLKNCMERKT